MRLTIDGQFQEFVSIKTFRETQRLPPDFNISLFFPKDYTGLGSIEHAGAALQQVREAVLKVIPSTRPENGWFSLVFRLQRLFRECLYEINPQVGLKSVEIEYAVAGFTDVLQAFVYAILSARMRDTPPPTFQEVYQNWLSNSTRVLENPIVYPHRGREWHIQLIKNTYGIVGMMVNTGKSTAYVYDPAHACPAAGFMSTLLADVAAKIGSAIEHEVERVKQI